MFTKPGPATSRPTGFRFSPAAGHPPAMATPDGPSFEEILTLIADASGGDYRRIPEAEQMPQVVDELLKDGPSAVAIAGGGSTPRT